MRVVNDRRSSTRVTVRGEALVYASQGPLCCRCLDISPSGMSVVSPKAVKPRQRVRIESSFKGQRLVLEAVVVRRSRSRAGHVLGLRFEGLDPRAHQQLAELLRTMQVQAALVMQSVSFVERLPMLQLPEPEPEPRTEKTPVMERAPAPAVAMPMPPPVAAPSPGPAQTGATLLPHATPPSAAMPALARPHEPVRSPPRPRIATPGRPRVGLEEGWTEDELVTTHYRPSDADADLDVVEALDDVDCTEVEATAGTITVTAARVPDWEPGAPVALAELVDTDAGSRMVPPSGELADDVLAALELDDPSPPARLDRTMLTPRHPALASFTTTSSGDDDDDHDGWRGPARTGKTMVIHVQDLIAAYGALAEPELDLPEPTAPITAPTTMPRLSDELQAALDRLRRREATAATTGANVATGADAHVEKEGAEEPAPRPPTGTRRHRRPGVTQVYATPRREDTQVGAPYHAALVNLGDSNRGDGS